jgi:hypothetical protein
VPSSPRKDGGVSGDLRGVAWPVGAVAEGDGEHCSMFRSDKVSNGTSCGAKQRQGHAVPPVAGASGPPSL